MKTTGFTIIWRSGKIRKSLKVWFQCGASFSLVSLWKEKNRLNSSIPLINKTRNETFMQEYIPWYGNLFCQEEVIFTSRLAERDCVSHSRDFTENVPPKNKAMHYCIFTTLHNYFLSFSFSIPLPLVLLCRPLLSVAVSYLIISSRFLFFITFPLVSPLFSFLFLFQVWWYFRFNHVKTM